MIKLFPNGAIEETLKPEPDGCVLSISLQEDEKILVGGCFLNIAQKNKNYLSRIMADSSLDETFNSKLDDCNLKSLT